MNIAYCIKLKQYAILDVSIIAIGFVMRVLIGGMATDIWISHWLVMMTFLVTLFLALTKRNDDYRLYEQTGQKPRISITGYNKTFINEATAIVASVTLVCYIMYTMSSEVIDRLGTRYVYLTSGWVLAGLFPKIGAIINIMPQPVLGGAAVFMFASIVISGINLITKEPLTGRNATIVAIALGLGFGLGSSSAAQAFMPQWLKYIFGGSGIVPAALIAILLNVVIPKDKQEVEA